MVPLNHPLFIQLASEHQKILDLLEEIEQCSTKDTFKVLTEKLWNIAEMKHHRKEEILLFNSIYNNPKIKEGGPMCSLFFDCHMSEKVKEKVENITHHPLTEEIHQKAIILSQSPLAIPLEEHRSGKDLLSYILKSFENLNLEGLKKFFGVYKKIQIDHFKKEANCMYPMCANLLTVIEADLINEKWKLDLVE